MKDWQGYLAFAAVAGFFFLVTWVAGIAQTNLLKEVFK